MKKNDLLTSHLLSSFNFIINREIRTESKGEKKNHPKTKDKEIED